MFIGWYLCAKEPGVSAAEVAASLPSIEEIIEMSPQTNASVFANWQFTNLFVVVALVWEKLERPAEALRYATAALQNDLANCGTIAPGTRCEAHVVQGRAQAALGHAAAAADAFEAAVDLAAEHGFWLYQALALKDLKQFVLDDLGHPDHAARRLGAALRLLKGPAELLTPLMDGLDAGQLMSMSPPDPKHEINYGDAETQCVEEASA